MSSSKLLVAPIEGTKFIAGLATGIIYLDANGLQKTDGPKYTAGILDLGPASTLLSEISTPANPAANGLKVYAKDNGGGETVLAVLDSAGTETELGGASGSPEGTSVLSTGEAGGVKYLREDGDGTCSWQTVAGFGDVSGPASATDTAIARFDLATGKLLQGSVVLVTDAGAITGVTDLTANGLLKSANVTLLNGGVIAFRNAGDSVDDVTIVHSTNNLAFTGVTGGGNNYSFDHNVDITGNITVSGTVDGRDVSADGTKLDGIEASATADQTGAEIKALYEAEANAFTDAQFTKLAGIEALADVTDEANVSATASVIANTAKATNATHTGDVTGSTVLTIAAGAVDIAMLANGTDGELITWDAAGAPSTVAVGTATHVLTSNGPGVAPTFQAAAGGSGDVVGPASSTDDAIARFDLGTGELLQNSVGILTDAGALSGLTAITVPGAGATSELFGASAVASAGNTTSVGNAATSTGEGATAVGAATDATSTNSTAVGYASQATGATSTAVGAGSDALALDCTAIGANAQAITGIRATAVGSVADAPGALTVAIGYDATASVDNNVAIGGSSLASGATSTAIGTYSDATAANCVAIGYNAQNTGANSLVIGRSASSDQTQAVVLGNFASCTTNTAGIAIGYSVTVSGARSIVIGTSASATGNDSIAFGSSALGDGTNSTAIGANTDANDTNATAIGNVAQANAAGSTAIGTGTDATATDSTALGYLAQATATYSTSVGSSADAAYSYSVAIGYHSTTESANTCVIGGRDSAAKNVSDLYLGHGETSAHAGVTDSGIHATGGSGTDIGGTNLVIAGGRPTGSGTGGSVSFKTAAAGASGSTLRALVEHMEIREDGLILLPTIPETDPEVEYALYNDGGYLAISAGGMP